MDCTIFGLDAAPLCFCIAVQRLMQTCQRPFTESLYTTAPHCDVTCQFSRYAVAAHTIAKVQASCKVAHSQAASQGIVLCVCPNNPSIRENHAAIQGSMHCHNLCCMPCRFTLAALENSDKADAQRAQALVRRYGGRRFTSQTLHLLQGVDKNSVLALCPCSLPRHKVAQLQSWGDFTSGNDDNVTCCTK